MQRLNLNDLVDNHHFWKERLPAETAEKYISLSRILLHKVIDTDGILSGITLSYPEDCSDYEVFSEFIEIVSAVRSVKDVNGSRIVTFD